MKKKLVIILIIVGILAVLFTPIPTGVCKDGGTRVYSALTYKIVDWNRISSYGIYEKKAFISSQITLELLMICGWRNLLKT